MTGGAVTRSRNSSTVNLRTPPPLSQGPLGLGRVCTDADARVIVEGSDHR